MAKDQLLAGVDPIKPFYMAAVVGHIDGSLSQEVEILTTEEAEAVSTLKKVNTEHPGADGYVYRCVPIKRVWRGNTRVTKIGR